MKAAANAQFLPLARRIAGDEGLVLMDEQLLAAIAENASSFRSVIFGVLRLAKTARHRAEEAAVVTSNLMKSAKQ